MAITYYTGVPRSGKTYKAMTDIYYNFVEKDESKIDQFLKKFNLKNDQKENYDNCYTNINQFNFDISEQIYPFEFESFYSSISELFMMSKRKADDSELIQKAKELNLYNTLFVIDECHNYLKSKDDSVLVWWFTYHAHLHHEIILITQDLTLVNSEYKRVAEYFYRAIPSRFRLSKNTFKYVQYSSYSMYQKDRISTVTVKANDKIFSLYVSGKDSNGKSIIHRYLYILILILIICIYLIFNFINSFNDTPNLENEEDETKTEIIQEDQKQDAAIKQRKVKNENVEILTDLENLQLYKFNCFSEYCYYFDQSKTYDIPLNILKFYLKDLNENRKFIKLKDNRLIIHILDDKNKFNFLKGIENEENNNSMFNTSK